MEWVWRKLDTFAGAVVIAAGGIASSQGQALIVQYMLRLSRHLNEAMAQLLNIQNGMRYKLMSNEVRKELEAEAQFRVDQLQTSYDAILGANFLTRPFTIFSHAEPTIISETWLSFTPSLPQDTVAIAYVVIGIILGFLFYELIKMPIVSIFHGPRRRRFKRRL